VEETSAALAASNRTLQKLTDQLQALKACAKTDADPETEADDDARADSLRGQIQSVAAARHTLTCHLAALKDRAWDERIPRLLHMMRTGAWVLSTSVLVVWYLQWHREERDRERG